MPTTDKKIAANRRNGSRSTGPRSRGGKKRSSRNAYRHGLSISLKAHEQVEHVAREIAGDTNDPITLELARTIAAAEVDIARVRSAKVALINHSIRQADPASPANEPLSSAEAMCRVLPELLKLDRYENRAHGRRDRAVLALVRFSPSVADSADQAWKKNGYPSLNLPLGRWRN